MDIWIVSDRDADDYRPTIAFSTQALAEAFAHRLSNLPCKTLAVEVVAVADHLPDAFVVREKIS